MATAFGNNQMPLVHRGVHNYHIYMTIRMTISIIFRVTRTSRIDVSKSGKTPIKLTPVLFGHCLIGVNFNGASVSHATDNLTDY